MAEGAALLVDHLLPAVGYRQWVLSFEGPLAVRLGYDRALLAKVAERLAKVAERLARAVMQYMRWSAKERHGLAAVESLHAGVFMVVQRFRSDLGLFVHLQETAIAGARGLPSVVEDRWTEPRPRAPRAPPSSAHTPDVVHEVSIAWWLLWPILKWTYRAYPGTQNTGVADQNGTTCRAA